MNQRSPQTFAKQESPLLSPTTGTICYLLSTGRGHPDTLISFSNLGNVLSMQGKYKEAEALHRQALEAREKVFGWGHYDMFIIVGNLSDVLSRQGKYEEAEAMHQRALEALEKVWGCEHPGTLTIVNSLGNVLSVQGKYKEAEAMPR
ncbi:uncharacterized protein N7506_000242 [Penicillium brevicompactum]|uniref:uncharacterized protein n=1 Tax=Penicillium brevicompactum TaxID=5074 RepID=UPI00253FAD66|nr:uncharacterized protein N7506_000242 [Penicillium brevicompactum]KAJ5346989.1 hypothetical protein N7506_000242 [Penicillium brevicompactum]